MIPGLNDNLFSPFRFLKGIGKLILAIAIAGTAIFGVLRYAAMIKSSVPASDSETNPVEAKEESR